MGICGIKQNTEKGYSYGCDECDKHAEFPRYLPFLFEFRSDPRFTMVFRKAVCCIFGTGYRYLEKTT
jgi:hypothetical protein